MICRRMRGGVDEVLLQWESTWVDADVVPPGRVVEVLLRRTVRGQNMMLVQWACTWSPVELCDAGALEEYNGDVLVDVAGAATAVVDQTLAQKKKARRARNRGW